MSSEHLTNLLRIRDDLEAEADAIADNLNSPGPNGEPKAGLKDPLIDREGYPRGDINIHEVRIKRNRLAVINTDYKNVMKDIEAEVSLIHANSTVDSIPALPLPSEEETQQKKTMLIPFAKLDEVQDESPAMVAGICNGDLLISFGGVDIATLSPMSVIPNEVSKYINKPMDVVVLRGSKTHSLSLTPCSWSGRGMIGCHLTPI